MSKRIFITQILIVLLFLGIWQTLAHFNIINTFIFSSPFKVFKTIIDLTVNHNLIYHIFVTIKEIIVSFILGITIAFFISVFLYLNPFIAKTLEPFLTMLNSMPKVALGPIIIIWVGANTKAIIFMALLINVIVSILNIYNGFINIDATKKKIFKVFKSNKKDELLYLVIPENKNIIVNTIKINISLTMIGVIMGEFLVSKSGIGYLIVYGTQVFNLDIVFSGIFILIFISCIIYILTNYICKKI